jgi:hypothetical protein
MNTGSITKFLLISAVVLVFVAGYSAHAATIIGTEGPDGFIGPLPLNAGSIGVASDGENSFQPFNISVDVSDAITFDTVEDGLAVGWFLVQGADQWTQLPGTQTWYIDAAQVGENEPAFNESV